MFSVYVHESEKNVYGVLSGVESYSKISVRNNAKIDINLRISACIKRYIYILHILYPTCVQ